jgi:DNA-binding NtrC family response regulator
LDARAKLCIVAEGASRALALPAKGTVILGRDEGCTVMLADAWASRAHAALHVSGDGIEVEDLGSRNGTWIGPRRLEPHRREPLALGASYRIGETLFLIHEAAVVDAIAGADAPAARGAPGEEEPPILASAAMTTLGATLDRVAASDLTVLFEGETGVGKEILARLLHARSGLPGAFVAVNCPALSAELLESELFGHERGAFTGAATSKPGLVELADRGTLFLDEVGDLPLALQAKLLRVLEERAVLPLGATEPHPAQARFVAATNRDLGAEVARGAFRQDLYHRLTGMKLRVPPLRERPEEIEPLARRFVARFAGLLGRSRAPVLNASALERLCAHRWPGNVRELRNAIERAVLLSGAGDITPDNLHLEARPTAGAMEDPVADTSRHPEAARGGELRRASDEVERARIVDALARSAGNQTRAAELLGISRRSLTNKLGKHRIPRPRRRGG